MIRRRTGETETGDNDREMDGREVNLGRKGRGWVMEWGTVNLGRGRGEEGIRARLDLTRVQTHA